MQVIIQPSSVTGNIVAPASKSSMQRACAAAYLRKGVSIIHNPGISNDDMASLRVIQTLGASVEELKDGALKIRSDGVKAKGSSAGEDAVETVNCGESGLCIRMFTPLVTLNANQRTITGEGSLLTRPMDFFDVIFPQLEIKISSNNGKLPLKVKGPLVPKDITIDGSLSSQFLTGLLMAYGAAHANDVTITVTNLKSKPYIDLSLKVMKDFGLNVPVNRDYKEFHFASSAINYKPQTIHYTIEGDWSGGAFLLVAGAIAGNITVKGLDLSSAQADKAVLTAFNDCGCKIDIQPEQIQISRSAEAKELKAFHFNASDCPDLFPPLAALASYCTGTTVIEGVHRLTHKESNRALTLQEEFGKMGVRIKLQKDVMVIEGGKGVKGAPLNSHHDHRIVMACAVAALKAEGETVINEAQAVAKSYPNFFDNMQKLGASLKLHNEETLKTSGIHL